MSWTEHIQNSITYKHVFAVALITAPTAFAYFFDKVPLKYFKYFESPEVFAYRYFNTDVEGPDKLCKLCIRFFNKNRCKAYS